MFIVLKETFDRFPQDLPSCSLEKRKVSTKLIKARIKAIKNSYTGNINYIRIKDMQFQICLLVNYSSGPAVLSTCSHITLDIKTSLKISFMHEKQFFKYSYVPEF